MLLAALRSLIKSEYVEGLTAFLCEKGNIITGTPKRYRLRLRESDAQFFQHYIQDEGGIEELKKLINTSLPESQRNIRDNTLGFIGELQKLSEGTASYEYETISIEHVLPRRPSPNSDWVKFFPSKEVQEKYVNRLGNLVLLSRGKNMKAENYDFDIKKQKYFNTEKGISPFVLTTQVLHYQQWMPSIIEERQRQLIGVLKQLWRL